MAELKGMAAFMMLSTNYMKNDSNCKNAMEKNPISIKMILETPDFPNSSLLEFQNGTFTVSAVNEEFIKDRTKWDVKMTAPAPVFLDYFLDKIGAIRPLLFGKIKVDSFKSFLKLSKMLWFVKLSMAFYKKNLSLSIGTFWKYYAYYHQ